MSAGALVSALILVALVVTLGALLWKAAARIRQGEIQVTRCPECERPSSRAYPACKHCGAPLSDQ